MTPEQLEILQVFSHPERVRMMALMGQRARSTQELVEGTDTTVGIVNAQIHHLRSVGLVDTERVEGRFVNHWLVKEKVADALFAFISEAQLRIPRQKMTTKKKAKKKAKKAKKKARSRT
jgi:hypothetical protein